MAPRQKRVSVIIQDSDDSQWSAFKYGLRLAAEDLGIEMFVVSTSGQMSVQEEEGADPVGNGQRSRRDDRAADSRGSGRTADAKYGGQRASDAGGMGG